MAVKKHELVQNPGQLYLNALAKCLQLNEQSYLASPNELIKNCQDIVKCLARAQGPQSAMWESLQIVEDFLVRVVNSVNPDVRHEIIIAIVDKLNQFISDPQSDACAASSVVLVVLNSDNEASRSAARWLVQQGEAAGGAGLRSSLSCLFTWLCQWNGTPSLGDWILSFIKALEENERFEILIEVSLDNLGYLFSAMDDPGALRQSSADVIFHVLASLRESTEALDVITPHVDRVLTNLASDSGQFSRQLLQNVVDIVTGMVDDLANANKDIAAFKNKYANVILCLERHMASRGCGFLQLTPWRARSVCAKPANARAPVRKVGLLNLGNTCYMNSVMQALLLTRQFSTNVMLRMSGMPYWAKMGVLFAKMMHSIVTKLDPDDFFKVVKPPFFTSNNQHDSSEFLGYLFELLQSFEHCSDRNFDYSKPAVLTTANRWRSASQSSSTSSDNEMMSAEPGPNRRSVSPRPGSSGGGSSSGSHKRSSPEHDNNPAKKRIRTGESAHLRRDSFIDSMFGGVLLTRVECTKCHASSLSRDVFRDLQLAFPDKPEGWQHSVQSLLEFYCSKETLTGDNQYDCRDCGCLRDAERSVLIETTPKYLILVLKNFKFEPKLHVQTKLMHKMHHNTTVVVPTASVRSPSAHAAYTLYAAVIHAGTTLDSGHYYTLAKDADAWFTYNDEHVSPAEEHHIHALSRSCTPYVLFYRRADVEEGAAPALEDLPPALHECVMAHNKQYVDGARNAHISRP